MIRFIVLFAFLLAYAQTSFAADSVPQSMQQVQLTFAPVVKKAAPSVVNIYAKRVVRERTRLISPFFNDPFFNQFFNAPQFQGPIRERVENSLGSGVIVDASGTIITNNHVIGNADKIVIVTADGREFEAEKVLADPKVDMAVLKIDPKDEKLQAVEFADSDAVQVGDLVLAIGNPFGVGQTVTSGIVSALARTQVTSSDYSFYIQTDAAINPGNSGGALVDTQGRLIGINTAIYSKDGGSLGIGFAIPSSMVKTVAEASRHGKKIIHPWVGITSQPVTPDIAENLKLKKAYGTIVNKVQSGSPADKAGIKVGDVITAINDIEIEGPQALRFRLATFPVGTEVKITSLRGGDMIDLKMVTATPPEKPERDTTELGGATPLSGAVVVNISPAVSEEMGPFVVENGVVISGIKNGSHASRFGFRQGDIILNINGKDVENVTDVKSFVKKQARQWNIQFNRGGQDLNLMVNG